MAKLQVDSTKTRPSSGLQAATSKGQKQVPASMEMPRLSYFTAPCSAPSSFFIFLLTFIIPLSTHASADG
ncbi:hypothetical protein CesoFtcFv8_003388 [Champsocephalus esox]|uniref:Uncharacterized protein n=1 Tax=Champsocephalus esox TaxID=159716 RepID=A0AAN8CSI9_9TELE|nr:hypothetical protein CesoFtcFv8_003388 [Champsocephalus esox]